MEKFENLLSPSVKAWLLSLEEQRRRLEGMVRAQYRLIEQIEAVRGIRGTLFYDLFTIFRRLSTQDEKVQAAERLYQSYFSRPIAPQRFNAIQTQIARELKRRAIEHDTSPEDEFKRATVAGLFIAVRAMENCHGERDSFEAVRTRLDKVVSDDLSSQTKNEQVELKEDLIATDDPAFSQAEMKMTLEAAIMATNLVQTDIDLLFAYFNGQSDKEIANMLNVKEATVKKRRQRIKEKMKKFSL